MKPPKKAVSKAASDLAKARWAKEVPDVEHMREIGKLGGRPKTSAKRCPCGAMTAKRAKARGHKC